MAAVTSQIKARRLLGVKEDAVSASVEVVGSLGAYSRKTESRGAALSYMHLC